ncbi:MAG: hypothetical protein ACUVTY_15300, partial [Armatimonadota bacterium]
MSFQPLSRPDGFNPRSIKEAPIGSFSCSTALLHTSWCRSSIILRGAHRRGLASQAYDRLRRSISTAGIPDRNSIHVEASG